MRIADKKAVPVLSIDDLATHSDSTDFEVVELDQAFRTSKRDVLSPHRHDYFEVFWISGGRGLLEVDFTEYPIKPPMLLLFSPGRVHAWKPQKIPYGFVFRFGAAFFASENSDPSDLNEMPIFYTIGGDPVLYPDRAEAEKLQIITQAAFDEFLDNGIEKSSALRSYMKLILIHAKRISEHSHSAQNQTPGFYLTRRFLTLVEQNYRLNKPLDFYARRLNVTSNHLTSTVKANINKTAGEVIRERQLIEAKRLLRYSELSVAEIAFELNFEDPSYFARFFRKYSAQTPTAFRQETHNS